MLEKGLEGPSPADMETQIVSQYKPNPWVFYCLCHSYKLTASISTPTMLNPAPSPNLPLVEISSSSGPSIRIESAANTSLHDSKRPQRSAAVKAAEKITQIDEDLPTNDALKKKKMPAAFQLSNKVIPDDAGNIKVR